MAQAQEIAVPLSRAGWRKDANNMTTLFVSGMRQPEADEQMPLGPSEAADWLAEVPETVLAVAGRCSFYIRFRAFIMRRLQTDRDVRVSFEHLPGSPPIDGTAVLRHAFDALGPPPSVNCPHRYILVKTNNAWRPLSTVLCNWTILKIGQARRNRYIGERRHMGAEDDDGGREEAAAAPVQAAAAAAPDDEDSDEDDEEEDADADADAEEEEEEEEEEDDGEEGGEEERGGADDDGGNHVVVPTRRRLACIVCSGDSTLQQGGCGCVYCEECLCNLVRTTPGTGNAMCPGGEGGQGGHRLILSIDMGRALQAAGRGLMGKMSRATRLDEFDKYHRACPSCGVDVVVGNFAKVFTCTNHDCVNPPFGYCVDCNAGIASVTPPHKCYDENEEGVRQLHAYLAQNGIVPCPGCGNAAEKRNAEECNHISCLCGTRYCGACGYTFPINRRGTADYNHTCVVRGNYEIDREHMVRVNRQQLEERERQMSRE